MQNDQVAALIFSTLLDLNPCVACDIQQDFITKPQICRSIIKKQRMYDMNSQNFKLKLSFFKCWIFMLGLPICSNQKYWSHTRYIKIFDHKLLMDVIWHIITLVNYWSWNVFLLSFAHLQGHRPQKTKNPELVILERYLRQILIQHSRCWFRLKFIGRLLKKSLNHK